MSDRDAIVETITRLFWHTDHHRWPDVEAVFADRVRLDYTSLQGGEPSTLSPGEIVGGWRDHFVTVPAHQHLVANHLVAVDDGDLAATATAQFIATHQFEDHRWTLGGDYEFRLVRADDAGPWLIEAMTMTAVWQQPGPVPAPVTA
ncbi:MAG: nuclear transport factor 2 family protein [Actinomycetota bacterium]